MRSGKEKTRFTLKTNQSAASSANPAQNANMAYAQYQKRFGGAAAAQPSPDVVLSNYARGGPTEQNLYKQLEVAGTPGQHSRNPQKGPMDLLVLDDRLEEVSDSKASNQQNMVGMGEVQRPLAASATSSKSGIPQASGASATHGAPKTRPGEEVQKELAGQVPGQSAPISLSINTEQASSMSRTKFKLADYLSPDANAALQHQSFGKGPSEESSALTERETPSVSASHGIDPLNQAWPVPTREGRESFLASTGSETRKKLGKSDYLTWKANRTPPAEAGDQEKPKQHSSFTRKPPIAGATPPLNRETFLSTNSAASGSAALRESRESRDYSTGEFGGKVQEGFMFQPLAQDSASAPQQSPDKIPDDRRNVVAMLTPKEAGRQYQYPEQNAPRVCASGSSLGGALQHEYWQGPVSAHPSAADEPLSEQGYRQPRPHIVGRDPAERDSVQNASPTLKNSGRNTDLVQPPFAVAVSADATHMKTEGSHNGDLLLPNQPAERPEQKAALSDNGRASPAGPGNLSAAQPPARRNLNHIAPLNSIFDSQALEKARRVNEEAAVKMAKIRAMQEEILRPKNKKAYSSTRSNHDYSDFDASQDEGRLTPTPGSLRNASQQEIGKSASFAGGKAAAREYFGKPPHTGPKRGSERASEQAFPDDTDPVGHPGGQTDGSQSERSSTDQVLLVGPGKQEHADEITKLRTQNGLLILERAFHARLKASKELCFRRWKNLRYERKKLVKLFGICGRQHSFQASLLLRKGFNAWKELGQRMINEIIQEELVAVTLMQKQLLTSVKETYAAKRRHKLLSTHFYAMLNLFRAKKEERTVQKNKLQAAKRLERSIRRQLKKRYRNSWKAIRGQVHASDLADEEVRSASVMSSYSRCFSVSSQQKRGRGSGVLQSEQNRMFHASNHSQSFSPIARHDSVSPEGAKSAASQQQIQMFQGCFKVSAVQFQRYLKQEKATVQSLFEEWKRKVREQQLAERMPKVDFLDSNLRPFERHATNSVPTAKDWSAERHVPDGAQSQKALPKPGARPGSSDGIYQSVFPQDQELLQRLGSHDNLGNHGLSSSDVSSVQLDSDDSDFCTTIEIIKLKPVKKASEAPPTKPSQVSRFGKQTPANPSTKPAFSPDKKGIRKPPASAFQTPTSFPHQQQKDSAKPPLPKLSSLDGPQSDRVNAILRNQHHFNTARNSSSKRSATPRFDWTEPKSPTKAELKKQKEEIEKQQRIDKYKRQFEKQIKDQISKQDEEEKQSKGQTNVDQKKRRSLLQPKSVYYQDGPSITSKSLAQLPVANIQHMFNPTGASMDAYGQKSPTYGSRNRTPSQIASQKATQQPKARQNSQLSFNSHKSNKSAQQQFDCSKPFVVVSKFDNANSNYGTALVTPKKMAKPPVRRTSSQRRVYQSSTYQPPTTRTRAMISRNRNRSEASFNQQTGDFTTSQSIMPKNMSTENSKQTSPSNSQFIGQGLTDQPPQQTFGASLNSDIPPTPPEAKENKTYLEKLAQQQNAVTSSARQSYEMTELNEFVKYEAPEVFSQEEKQPPVVVLSDEDQQDQPEQVVDVGQQQPKQAQEKFSERESMESLNRRSFADRVQSAFDKVAGPMQEGEELNKRATLDGKESPPYFLKETFGSLKKQINQQSKEKFVMRRETFGQDVKKEDMPVYSDYTTPENQTPRSQSLRPATGCDTLSPQSQPNQVQQNVRREAYEHLARATAGIFETRQKKFEVEFMLNLCLIYEQESEEAEQEDQNDDQFQFYQN